MDEFYNERARKIHQLEANLKPRESPPPSIEEFNESVEKIIYIDDELHSLCHCIHTKLGERFPGLLDNFRAVVIETAKFLEQATKYGIVQLAAGRVVPKYDSLYLAVLYRNDRVIISQIRSLLANISTSDPNGEEPEEECHTTKVAENDVK